MNRIRVHFDPATGRIIGSDNAPIGPALLGGEIAIFDVKEGHEIKIDPTSQRIDLATFDLEDMSAAEIRVARGPQDWEVKQAIALEMISTDAIMPADRYVPDRDGWVAYRQALRDHSKPQDEQGNRFTPIEAVEQFPARPDGKDAVASLRARITQG